MTDASMPPSEKRSGLRNTILLGAIGALVLGAGGFATTYLSLIPEALKEEASQATAVAPLGDLAFVTLDPLTISLGPHAEARHLRFVAVIEAPKAEAATLQNFMPRIMDVLNGYLRAVDIDVLEDPAMLQRLKAQMLRRIQIVTGEGRVNDLLISEFTLH